ncbi:MAG: sugar phosphate isomerase/epimerase [Opitutae bacterium]|nr:sugar phosphate isomerase/epimerase [Opitutae bacterium]
MQSCITLSLVSSLKGGPWVLWDDLGAGLRKAAELGFDAVELFTEGPQAGMPNELKNHLNVTGLRLAAVGTGAGKVLNGLTLTDENPDIRASAMSFIREMINFGAEYNAPAIIGSMQGVHGGNVSKEQAINWLQKSLVELGEHARTRGVSLIYEPLNRYESNLFNHYLEACDFLDQLPTNGVSLLADLFHMNIEETDIAESIKKGARHLGHVHFADSNRRPMGNGHTNMAPIAKALKEIGYEGCISAEAFAWPDSLTAAQTTIDSYKKYFP